MQRVSANFHRPNPRVRDDIEAVVEMLTETGADKAQIVLESSTGVDPSSHPLMQSAMAMQLHDYGTIGAKGVDPEGKVSKYSSRKHPIADRVSLDDEPVSLSRRGLFVKIGVTLQARVAAGLR